ncbi:MAG TPA: hypothetical protein VIM23_02735 [Gaiellaceae bacterium]|jgi:hypothetical protein
MPGHRKEPREIPEHLAQYLARSVLKDLPESVYETLAALTPEELDLLERVGASLHAAGCDSHSYAFVIH